MLVVSVTKFIDKASRDKENRKIGKLLLDTSNGFKSLLFLVRKHWHYGRWENMTLARLWWSSIELASKFTLSHFHFMFDEKSENSKFKPFIHFVAASWSRGKYVWTEMWNNRNIFLICIYRQLLAHGHTYFTLFSTSFRNFIMHKIQKFVFFHHHDTNGEWPILKVPFTSFLKGSKS